MSIYLKICNNITFMVDKGVSTQSKIISNWILIVYL
jgi:hypothetical protein